jgi:hypothetical protein
MCIKIEIHIIQKGCLFNTFEMSEFPQEYVELLKSLHKKIDIVMQQNTAILAIYEKKGKEKLEKRRNSSRRGLGRKDIDMQLKMQPKPSIGFFEWIDSIQRKITIESGFIDLLQSVDKFEMAVFTLLQGSYMGDGSPIFSIKMEKNNYIYDAESFRLMNEADMKRVMLLFQCRCSTLLDDWYHILIPRDSEIDDDSEKSGTELHFNKRLYDSQVEKVNRLILNDSKVLRTLLRKFNTYMLEARGIVFVKRRSSEHE